MSDGAVRAHHGQYCPVDTLMSESVDNVITWLAANPDEIVIIYVSHFEGSGTTQEQKDASAAVLSSLGVDTIREDACTSDLAGLTIGGVKVRAALPNGGYLLAVFEGGDCMEEQYPAQVTVDNGIVTFDAYMGEATNHPDANYADNGKLFMAQALWQGAGNHVSLEENNPSGGGLNDYVANNVANGEYNFVNFLEVNNVCNNGPDVKLAIDTYFNEPPISNCLGTNGQLTVGGYLQSNNGMFQARLDTDGKMCIYDVAEANGDPIIPEVKGWCTPTIETAGILKMQGDGNLVLYTPTNQFYWATGTNGGADPGGHYLILQNDKNLVMYPNNTPGNNYRWACGANGCTYITDNSCVNCSDNECREATTTSAITTTQATATTAQTTTVASTTTTPQATTTTATPQATTTTTTTTQATTTTTTAQTTTTTTCKTRNVQCENNSECCANYPRCRFSRKLGYSRCR